MPKNKLTGAMGKPFHEPWKCVGEGWHPIVKKLIDDLFEIGWDGKLLQVKEKFGGLRFYTGPCTPQMYDIIDEAEDHSLRTCEACGKPGEVYGDYWLKTLCKEHQDEREKEKASTLR